MKLILSESPFYTEENLYCFYSMVEITQGWEYQDMSPTLYFADNWLWDSEQVVFLRETHRHTQMGLNGSRIFKKAIWHIKDANSLLSPSAVLIALEHQIPWSQIDSRKLYFH